MGLRDRLSRVRKAWLASVPADMRQGAHDAGMDQTRPFAPGEPIGPFDGYSRHPRQRDFVTGYNIAARPRTHERVSFDALKGLIDAYDVARICIWHRIDSIRALDWSLVPAKGFAGDADDAIAAGLAVLETPDRQTPFAAWLARWLFDVLAFDAGCLSRMRNRSGRCVGLETVDGTTVAPLLDYWGRSPEPPAEAYVQYVQGLPFNWLTRNDLVYQPFRPVNSSPYGQAPLESILLNANTDLRFQAYFLQRFTEGNIPQAFASAPEGWGPDQVEQFQTWWDALMYGDQTVKHQIRWMPGGSSIQWSSEKDFQDHFSLFLMRKTCAAYHVVPADLGFTESVNRSSGETQADVQHRVGDLPLISYIQNVLTHFLRHDLGLPVEFSFDTGQEKEDRLTLAQAWQIYIQNGIVSADEAREQLVGLPADPQRPTPRFFSTPRVGPVPLLEIQGVAGRVDPETYGPAKDQQVLPQPFVPAPGVVPAEGTADAKSSTAAEDTYQGAVRQALQRDVDSEVAADANVAKGDPTSGITADTGIVGHDLIGHHDDEDVRAELRKFKRYRRIRQQRGVWDDFTFTAVDPVRAHRLNDAGRLAVRKAAGEIGVAGLAVRAADTGRVLMLQRALCDDDPAAGMWEVPGGHIEQGETPLQAAWREWAEETGLLPPPGAQTGQWVNGIYAGFVWTVESESCVPISADRGVVTNPDDPDGDVTESLAWMDVDHLPGNPGLRQEMADSLHLALPELRRDPVGKALTPTGVTTSA